MMRRHDCAGLASGDGKSTIKNGKTQSRTIALLVLAAALVAFDPAAAETAKIATSGWYIHKPSKQFKDLPALLPKEQNGFEAGIGLIEFVCLNSTYYVLLVQPSVKLRDIEPGAISVRAASASNAAAPITLPFRSLYKMKSLLSRSLNWDADIHYAEVNPALLASIETASDLELALAGQSYTIALSDIGSRLGSFQRFCEKGVIENPAHFEKP
jgi:hypothetical protein